MARASRVYKVGTRRSLLATTQTGAILSELKKAHPDVSFEITEIVTKGDRIQGVALSQVGGKGLFISEIEDAILSGKVDFAVHSMKDVPAQLAPGLVVGAIPLREDPRDLLITKGKHVLRTLPEGASVGTSSLRRSAQLKRLRPDLAIETLRGNIDTRLRRLEGLDAIVLATAGLARMGWWGNGGFAHPDFSYHAFPIGTDDMVPAVGQGALALECRALDDDVLSLLMAIHNPLTATCVGVERAFLERVGGSCQVPVAAHAVIEQGGHNVSLQAMIGLPDGSIVVKGESHGSPDDDLGTVLADQLLEKGGSDILKSLATLS